MDKGDKFGSWTVESQGFRDNSTPCNNKIKRMVKCDCGTKSIVEEYKLRVGKTLGCASCASIRGAKDRTLSDDDYIINRIFEYYKKSAIKRGLDFALNRQHFKMLIFNPCHYCGKLRGNRISRRTVNGGKVCYNGLDRLDPGTGYHISNVVPCCGQCNDAKGTMDYQEFYEWLGRVSVHSLSSTKGASI